MLSRYSVGNREKANWLAEGLSRNKAVITNAVRHKWHLGQQLVLHAGLSISARQPSLLQSCEFVLLILFCYMNTYVKTPDSLTITGLRKIVQQNRPF